MGNSPSINSNTKKDGFDNFYQIIDYIATYYILTMDFQSLSKLSQKEYCDKLVIITADIIKKNFTDLDITYLAQRIKGNVEVNELSKENVSFVNRDLLESLDIKNDAQKTIKKKRVCIGIAKFYVKIAHIFAAIVKTINPIYVYKDVNGNIVKKGLLEKNQIPKNVKRKIYKLNICDNRIRKLKSFTTNEENKTVNMNIKMCDLNMDSDGNVVDLDDEPGINELMTLYLDDEYDYSNGNFTGMSENTKKQFQKDLKTFYTAFTGNEVMPPEIQKFSDIKLKSYGKTNGCEGNTPIYKTSYFVSKNDKLFLDFAENIKNMINNATNNQQRLLSIINDLFTFVTEPYTNNKKIRVNPQLTEEKLQMLMVKTRNIIIELYVKCEKDFVAGLKIYEAIVERKILETTKQQIINLEKNTEKIIKDTNKVLPNVIIPQQPNVIIPQQPNVIIPQQPNVIIPQQPNVIIPQQPNVIIPSQQNIENNPSNNIQIANVRPVYINDEL